MFSIIFPSEIKPAFTTSANPAAKSRSLKVLNQDESTITAIGEWKAPIKFFPYSLLIAVLPPIAASTAPATVVGIAIQSIPRNHDAAAKPAKSVVAPPPIPMIRSLRVNPAAPSQSQIFKSVALLFPDSPSGIGKNKTSVSVSGKFLTKSCIFSETITAALFRPISNLESSTLHWLLIMTG
ncbi:unannotated protein [freshwater metagenome]|uniref:Unannotated protein n=1 Tax=freshwater metagenome TaxID=449393 RepID=A0A6J6F574_9ZZZZ